MNYFYPCIKFNVFLPRFATLHFSCSLNYEMIFLTYPDNWILEVEYNPLMLTLQMNFPYSYESIVEIFLFEEFYGIYPFVMVSMTLLYCVVHVCMFIQLTCEWLALLIFSNFSDTFSTVLYLTKYQFRFWCLLFLVLWSSHNIYKIQQWYVLSEQLTLLIMYGNVVMGK